MSLYQNYLELQVGGKRVNPHDIDKLCDWGERTQPTPLQLQVGRVYEILFLQCLSTKRTIVLSLPF
ncbi:hypothetical protein EFU43_14670 [Vibrio cholerae]|nr:hypothetical protein [Vibrio cholerae]